MLVNIEIACNCIIMQSISKSTRSGGKDAFVIPKPCEMKSFVDFQQYKIKQLNLKPPSAAYTRLKDVSKSYMSQLKSYLLLGQQKFRLVQTNQQYRPLGNDDPWQTFELAILHLVVLINRDISPNFTKDNFAFHAKDFIMRRKGVILTKMASASQMIELSSVTAAVKLAHQHLDIKLEQAANRILVEYQAVYFEERQKQAGDQLRKCKQIKNQRRDDYLQRCRELSKRRTDIAEERLKWQRRNERLLQQNCKLELSTRAKIE